MTPTLRKFSSTLILFCLSQMAYATSEAFVRGRGGVWVASDTLLSHADNGHVTKSTICKVIVQRGRIMFNAGEFSDVRRLMTVEAGVPQADFETSSRFIATLLRQYSWLPDGSPTDPSWGGQSFGVVQVVNGLYSGGMVTLSVDLHHYHKSPVLPPFTAGIPHGFSDAVERERIAAQTDAALRRWISEHPKAELLKMLREETQNPLEGVAPPYTVFLLHEDGTVSDYSRVHVCKIPEDALYRVPPTHRAGSTKAQR